MKRVLLLGATGFIGSGVLNLLRQRDDVQLMVLGHRNVDYKSLEDVNLVVDDLTRFDLSWIERFRPDTIIHLARLRGKGRFGRSLASRRGSRANKRLITWLSEHAADVRVLYVSGTLVYGDHGERDVDEQTPLNPIAFAREYVRAEEPWMNAQSDGRLPTIIVRPPWIVGPGSWFYNYYAFPAMNDGAVPLYGSGQNWMSFLDVTDCAGLIVYLAEKSESGKTHNLFAPGQFARQIDFVQALSDAMGVEIRQVNRDDSEAFRNQALWEALTFSLRASTINDELKSGYEFHVPHWRDMISRNLMEVASR